MTNSTFITEISTEQTGGGVMNDFLTMDDGTVLVICDHMIALYNSIEDYYAGEWIDSIDR